MKKLNKNDILNKLKLYNPKLKIENINDYLNSKSELIFKCDCGNKWISKINNVLKSSRRDGCQKCQKRAKSLRKYSKSNDAYLKEVKEIWGNKIDILTDYITGETKIKAKCNLCNHIWETSARSITRGTGCPKCGHKRNIQSTIKTHDNYISDLYKIHMNRITLKDKYHNSYIKLNFNCNICKHNWMANPSTILTGRGCPKCNLSKGEILIYNCLKNLNISFKEQYIIDGLKTEKGGYPVFDFVIFDDDNKISSIIEYDGMQHFLPIKRFGGEKRFEAQKRIDNFKNLYCLENKIKMIRIPYTELKNIDVDYINKLL